MKIKKIEKKTRKYENARNLVIKKKQTKNEANYQRIALFNKIEIKLNKINTLHSNKKFIADI